jgi:tetratricopeptide (TPR) repeat protein
VSDSSRIDELRRRVQKDPASIAFAQLAEEYRRAGEYNEAVQICRGGLEKHPTYLSARVTLGRALIELEQYDEARTELEYVLQAAPENLAAIRGLAEIHQRRGEPAHAEESLAEPATAEPTSEIVSPGIAEPLYQQTTGEIPQVELAGEWELETFAPVATSPPPRVDDALAEELPHEPVAPVDPVVLDPADQAALAALESWLETILEYRNRRIHDS